MGREVLADQEQADWNGRVDLPGFDGMRCELIGERKHADGEDGRSEQLIEDELGSLNRVPAFVERRLDVSNQCPRPQPSQERADELPDKVQLELVVPVLDVHAYRNHGIDVPASHFSSKTDSQEQRAGNDDIGRDVQARGARAVDEYEASERLEEDDMEPATLDEALHSDRIIIKIQVSINLFISSSCTPSAWPPRGPSNA